VSSVGLSSDGRQQCKCMPISTAAKLEAICLDLDGTLYIHQSLRFAMASRLFLRYVTQPLRGYETVRILSAYRRAQEMLRDTSPDSAIADAQLQMTCRLSGVPLEKVADCVATWFEQEPLALLRRFVRPGLKDFLSNAKRRGVKLAVLSDYPADKKLTAIGVREYFDLVVCAQDAGVQCFKPNPAGLRLVLQRLGVDKANAVYVGDRLAVDAETARRAGVRSVIIGRERSTAPFAPSRSIRDFKELESALFS
ncbi:MAG: HAD family hydrolase, partial [Candidatus Binataceae bacterium]